MIREQLRRIVEYGGTRKGRVLVFACLIFGFFVFSIVRYVTATESTNINAESRFAWSESGGWLNFGSGDGGVMVADAALSGYVWSENFGWISLNCSNDDSCAASDYRVANDGEGNLTGYAWGENIGWVNFAPADGGVRIDSAGEFSGYAWAENIGWIVFNCQDLDVCAASDFKVKTTWLPMSARDQDEDEEREGVEVSDVRSSSTDATIVINWKTNHDADSHVRWGKDKNLKEEKNDDDNEKKHRTVLRNLEPETEYHFRVKSTDENDNSDSSRIYSVSTKPVSAVFSRRQWGKMPDAFRGDAEYEKIDITVTDKTEKSDAEAGETEEVKIPERPAEAGMSDDGEQDFGAVSIFFSGMRSVVAGIFSSVYDLMLSGQRKIAKAFNWTGDKIASVHTSFVAKFNEEKANEIARLNKAKYFTTEVFNRDEKKLLAEVRFQILDKSDSPIPGLEATLFSDPQTVVTDSDGVATFEDVPIGSHTLAFDYKGENFHKNVAIADTLTDEGKVRAEIVQVKAEKEKLAVWMWGVIALLAVAIAVAVYFARQYYRLKKNDRMPQGAGEGTMI
jgi:hypothetical protein